MDKTDVNTLIDNVEREIKNITNVGLSSNNFDTCYRLVDMLYMLQTIKYSSDNKKSCYEAYSNAKRQYRKEHSNVNEEIVISSIKDYMTELSETLHDMISNCDCCNERDVIKNFISNF